MAAADNVPDLSSVAKNGWAEYQRLVLTELERHNTMISDIMDKLSTIEVQIALLKKEQDIIGQLQKDIRDLRDILSKTQENNRLSDGLKKYRNWILGGIFTIIVSVAIPLINLVFTIRSGSGK